MEHSVDAVGPKIQTLTLQMTFPGLLLNLPLGYAL